MRHAVNFRVLQIDKWPLGGGEMEKSGQRWYEGFGLTGMPELRVNQLVKSVAVKL